MTARPHRPPRAGAAGLYSTADVARMLALPERRIRSFVTAGFLEPARHGRAYRFSFTDLVVLRAAQGLVQAEVPTERIHRALRRLVRQLPEGRSLGSVRILARGQRVVVSENRETWEAESGQLLFEFSGEELEERTARLAEWRRAEEVDPVETPAAVRIRQTEAWYATALDLEDDGEIEEAEQAYRHTLDLEPDHVEAHLNLGRLLHHRGHHDLAEPHYRHAAEHGDPTALFNLGVLLQDQERYPEAVEAYRRVVEADPAFADAYFNLAGLYEHLGDQAIALQTWQRYRALRKG